MNTLNCKVVLPVCGWVNISPIGCLPLLYPFFNVNLTHVFVGGDIIPMLNQYGGITAFKTEYGHNLPLKNCSSF